MSNLSSSFFFQMDMLKTLEDMFWTGSGHVLKTCPSDKMSHLSRSNIPLPVNQASSWRTGTDLWSSTILWQMDRRPVHQQNSMQDLQETGIYRSCCKPLASNLEPIRGVSEWPDQANRAKDATRGVELIHRASWPRWASLLMNRGCRRPQRVTIKTKDDSFEWW